MTAASNGDVLNLFKKVYGNLQDLLPEDQMLAKLVPFSQSQKVGESYVEAVTLTHETGITLGGSGLDVFELESPIAGTVKQALVTPYVSVLGSLIPWSVISRSAGGGAKSFYDATKYVVRNNLRSHQDFLEAFRLYGQSPDLLGYVSYATATYRGVAFTAGSGTLPETQFGSVTFTNGVDSANKYILVAPGQFAAGLWVGKEGVKVVQVNSAGAVVAEGSLVAVDPDMGILKVDFTPVAPSAASGAGSLRIAYKGMDAAKEMLGIHKILTTSTSLFGIPTSQYSLWKGNVATLSGVQFKLQTVQTAIAQAVNRGALEGDVEVLVNPRTFSTLVTTESGARRYDSSYGQSAENGFENIEFWHQAGKATIRSHRKVKEGHAFLLSSECWSRSGSAEVAFSVPGVDKDIIFPEPNMSAYSFRTYSDQYIFCHAPAKNILVTGINDESAS